MVTIKVEEDYLVDMLMNRLEHWIDDDDGITYRLFEKMYEHYVDSGCFDGAEIDIMQIVDNDYINYCTVLTKGDDEYDNILAIYNEQGLGDCSCENDVYSYIEAEQIYYDKNDEEKIAFLVRC